MKSTHNNKNSSVKNTSPSSIPPKSNAMTVSMKLITSSSKFRRLDHDITYLTPSGPDRDSAIHYLQIAAMFCQRAISLMSKT